MSLTTPTFLPPTPITFTDDGVPSIPVRVGSPPAYSAMPFAWHVDILLICLFGVFILTTVPRLVARYAHTSEWGKGLFLRRGRSPVISTRSDDTLPPAADSDARSVASDATVVGAPTDDSHTLNSHSVLVMPKKQGSAPSGRIPTRIPSWLALSHPTVSYLLNYPVVPGCSIAHLAVLLVWFGITMYLGTRGTSPFTDPRRPADIAVAQLPIVIALATKNSIPGLLSGLGYEKLNYLHRFGGRIIVLTINLHTIYYLYRWSMDGTIAQEARTAFVIWGCIGTAAVDVIFICSLQWVRQRFYGVFVVTHILGFIAFAVAMLIHEPPTLPYLLAAVILYAVDHGLRILRTRTETAYVTAHPSLNGGSTHLVIPALTSGWRAGQHVRVRVVDPDLSPVLGWLSAWVVGRWRARPFSIANRPGSDNGLELLMKKQGRSTTMLYRAAGGYRMELDEKNVDVGLPDLERGKDSRKVKVVIEGPYGGPGHTLFETHSGAMLVAGGSGITYALSLLDELIEKHARGESRLRVIELVWTTADPSSAMCLIPTFRRLLRPRASPHGSLAVSVTVHYTRAPMSALPAPESIPAGFVLRPGRLNVRRCLESTIESTIASHPKGNVHGLVIGACGPTEIGESVHKAIGSLTWAQWRDVGGVEVVGESFGM